MPRAKRKESDKLKPLLLKIPEAAELLNCSVRHADDLADQGLLEKRYLDHAKRVTLASVLQLAGVRSITDQT